MSRNKPHNFIDRTGERRQNTEGYWMEIVECFGARNNTVTFDTGKVKHGVAWQDFKIGKVEHPLVYEETIAYHIECELGENLYDIVNMKKCKELGLDPYEIKRGSKIELWFLCQKVDYHNDSDGYKCSCNHFTSRNQRCPLCSPHPKHIHIKDSIVSRPDILNMILIPENNLTLEDCAKLSPGSSKSFYVKHSKCGKTSSKKTQIRNITNNVWHCEYCYVGISMSEKFMSNILYQLKEQKQIDSFKNHVQSNILSWANNYEYDFYVTKNIITYIFETHGIQHYEEIDGKWGRGLKFEQENDRLKRELALDNNIDIYEEIDCRESTFEWLKENIMTKLSQYFDLSNIDWKLAWKESQDTKVSECWALWNSGIHSSGEISSKLNISGHTVVRYLKRGVDLGLCDYNFDEAKKEQGRRNRGKNNYRSTPVICLTTKKLFFSQAEGKNYYNIKNNGDISRCCSGATKYAGELKDGTKLVWKYINYKHNKKYRIKSK